MVDSDRYWDSTDLERVQSCGSCGGSMWHMVYSRLIDYEEGVPGEWNISRCVDCRSLILDPRPTNQALAKAYGSYYTHFSPSEENRVLFSADRGASLVRDYLTKRYGFQGPGSVCGMGKWLLEFLHPIRLQIDYFMRNLPRNSGKVLDVGCGSGGFLVRASMCGWMAYGVEPDAVAAAIARSESGCFVAGDLDSVPEEVFDVVTLSHVIEHLHSPAEVLNACFGKMRSGGVIWIATPNVDSFGHIFYGRCWQPLETPRHLLMPPAEALCEMLKRAGFIDIRFLRRGRGASKRIAASAGRARAEGRSAGVPRILGALVDMIASFSSRAGEELVVVAIKPSP